jgi:large subunit ribosomal protein L1
MSARRAAVVGPGRVGTLVAHALTASGTSVVRVAGGSDASRARLREGLAGVRDVPVEEVAQGVGLVVIATPDAMRVVGQLGQILGPRGLMPNPKVGTVTPDVVTAVKNAKGGQVRYRTDKAGIIHCAIGAVDFESQALTENLNALLADLMKLKPSTAKGIYVRRVTVSSTMGPGLQVDPATLSL